MVTRTLIWIEGAKSRLGRPYRSGANSLLRHCDGTVTEDWLMVICTWIEGASRYELTVAPKQVEGAEYVLVSAPSWIEGASYP